MQSQEMDNSIRQHHQLIQEILGFQDQYLLVQEDGKILSSFSLILMECFMLYLSVKATY